MQVIPREVESVLGVSNYFQLSAMREKRRFRSRQRHHQSSAELQSELQNLTTSLAKQQPGQLTTTQQQKQQHDAPSVELVEDGK
jgi:hypothetical protein